MSDDFASLDHLLDGLIEGLTPAERGRLSRDIARDLRTANARRIKANVTPDGTPMAPRRAMLDKARPAPLRGARATKGSKLGPMFQRATGPSILRGESTGDEAVVGYPGAMARVMSVHHFGLRDRVTPDPASPQVTYAARPLIGLPEGDRARIFDKVVVQVGSPAVG